MLEVRDVHKWYGPIHAVAGVSFSVARGQVVGLLGPNGAGKTTTIRMITGVFPPHLGAIVIDGYRTLDAPERTRRSVGYLPESAPLYPEMLVEGYLAYRARLFGVPARRRRALIDRSIELGSLGEVRSKRIGTLSKGFRQRVGLAAATLHEPGLLVLDEPANGLDPTQIRHMRETIRSLAQSSGVLLSSHILAEVELTCDRVVVVAGGRVLADGSPAHLRSASAQGNSIHAEIPEAAAMAATIALRSIGGVRSVDAARSGDGWRTLQISLDPAAHVSDAEACTRISQALHSIGVVPRTLAPESPTLERAFHQLLESAARQNKPEGAAA